MFLSVTEFRRLSESQFRHSLSREGDIFSRKDSVNSSNPGTPNSPGSHVPSRETVFDIGSNTLPRGKKMPSDCSTNFYCTNTTVSNCNINHWYLTKVNPLRSFFYLFIIIENLHETRSSNDRRNDDFRNANGLHTGFDPVLKFYCNFRLIRPI